MDDGLHVPGAHDGMAAFPGRKGQTILVRNHEMGPGQVEQSSHRGKPELLAKISRAYDNSNGHPFCLGGTTTLIYDTRSQQLVGHFLSLAGTIRNCSGGPTPWGSWLTCEETTTVSDRMFEQSHGYTFEVPVTHKPKLADPIALKEMGRFNHEAVAVHPASGIVYQTEDRPDSLIYRYIPKKAGKLAQGGRLQALSIRAFPSQDTRNWAENSDAFEEGHRYETEWIDIENVEAPQDDLRYQGFDKGAARFARGEGMVYGNGEIYFACTNGGKKQFGQVFRYLPSKYEGNIERENKAPGTLELFVESHDKELMKNCDNLCIAPWGDVILCEDDGKSSAIVGITPEGKMYHIGHIDMNSELAGSCFSPDGATLFINAQRKPGQTIAITGPWKTRKG